MKAGKSKICLVGWPDGDPGELMVQMKFKGSLLENFILLLRIGRGCLFCYIQTFKWLAEATYIMEGNNNPRFPI